MLITATAILPATHTLFEDVQDVSYGIAYSMERETLAAFVEVGFAEFGELGTLTVEFTWPGYLHQARAALADYRIEGETDAGVFEVALTEIHAA